jgi:hypothetical protein
MVDVEATVKAFVELVKLKQIIIEKKEKPLSLF